MKKQLFLSTGLVLTSLLGFVGCGNELTSSEQQKVYKDEVKEINQKTTNKFEEEYKKDNFAFTFNTNANAALKGSISTYSTTTDLSGNTTSTTPEVTPLNESISADATAILSFDTAYYRALNTTSPKSSNESYAYVEANAKASFSDAVKEYLEVSDEEVKAQAVLKDGTGTAYAKVNTNQEGETFTYNTYDNYISAGVATIDQVLTKETTKERIEELRKILKTYASVDTENSAQYSKYIDVVCDALKSLSEIEASDEITTDEIYEIVETYYKQYVGKSIDEETKTKIKTIVEKVVTVIKEYEIITVSKQTSNSETNYTYSLNYSNLITAVKAALEAVKQYAIEQVPAQSTQITTTFSQITTIIDTYLANINVTQNLTFTVKDNLLTGVKEEFKVADFTFAYPVSSSYNNETGVTIKYASISISEASFTTSFSYEFNAKAKADLPTVPTLA